MTGSTGAKVWKTIWPRAAGAVIAGVFASAGLMASPGSAPAAAGSPMRTSAPPPVQATTRAGGGAAAPVAARLTAAVAAAAPVRMVTLHVYTVPPEPGVPLLFDGQPVTTDAAGVAVISTPYRRTAHVLKLMRPEWTSDNGRIQTKFTVWRSPLSDQKHSATLTHLVLRRNHVIQLGFRVSYQVSFSFVTTGDQSVPSSRVSGVELRADGGYVSSVAGGRTIRLLGVQPVQEAGTLVAHTVGYTLESVVVDGSNVVNAGQQRVSPTRQQSAKFILQLRQLTITAHDRLFGMHTGRAVAVTYPDGRHVSYRFNRDRQVILTGLARGRYQIRIDGGGFLTSQTVVLSRNQIVNMPILTWPDIVTLLAALAGLAVFAVIRQRRGSRAAGGGGQGP
jgi:hypothetical protein